MPRRPYLSPATVAASLVVRVIHGLAEIFEFTVRIEKG